VTTNAVVYLKDFRRFSFDYKTPEDCQDMVDALEVLSKPGTTGLLIVHVHTEKLN
jgi:hypothetical protein